MPRATVAVVPLEERHHRDLLFDPETDIRDDVLRPWRVLRAKAEALGIEVHTVDRAAPADIIVSLDRVVEKPTAPWLFYIGEPRAVRPDLYRRFDELTKTAARVFTHSLDLLERASNVRHFSYPQVFPPSVESAPDRKFLVMLNANKRPVYWRGELYTKRLRVAARLADLDVLDVYGPGWDETRRVYRWAPWTNKIRRRWLGTAVSKHSVLAKYDFCLAFENFVSRGYITEKIFDPMSMGCIPIYLGDPTVESVVPAECFVDFRESPSLKDLLVYLRNMSTNEKESRREAMESYLDSPLFQNRFSVDAWVKQLLDEVEVVLLES